MNMGRQAMQPSLPILFCVCNYRYSLLREFSFAGSEFGYESYYLEKFFELFDGFHVTAQIGGEFLGNTLSTLKIAGYLKPAQPVRQ